MAQYTINLDFCNYMELSNVNTNHGNDTNMIVGGNSAVSTVRGLVKADLSSIPPTSRASLITPSIMYLYCYENFYGTGRTIQAYRCLRDWVETTSTWSVWKTSNGWTSAGAAGIGTDRESASAGSGAGASAPYWQTITMDAALLEDLWDGTLANYGWVLKNDTESNDYRKYYTDDNGTNKPYIVINTEDGSVWTPHAVMGLFEKMKRHTKLYQELLAKRAIPLGNRELMPI